jgi:hypothetical protein
VTAPVALVILLLLTLVLADAELRALADRARYVATVGVLSVLWIGVRLRTSRMAEAVTEAEFEDAPGNRVQALGLWDSRIQSRPAPHSPREIEI